MQQTKVRYGPPPPINTHHLEAATLCCKGLNLDEETSSEILVEVVDMMISYEIYELLLTPPTLNKNVVFVDSLSMYKPKQECQATKYNKHWYNKSRW